jgi:rhodanese-related sulfurtransferase
MKWLFGKKEPEPPKDWAALDQLTLQQLAKAGGDLSRPTDVVSYLYLPTEQQAQQAGAELRQAGYSVEVRPAATGSTWLALARMDLVPNRQNIQMLRSRFDALAAKFGGEFDGWEAAITK